MYLIDDIINLNSFNILLMTTRDSLLISNKYLIVIKHKILLNFILMKFT